MRHTSLAVIGLWTLSFCLSLISPAFAANGGTLTDAEKATITQPCKFFDVKQQPSCANRLLTRALQYGPKADATKAMQIYDQMDLGKAKIRKITTDIRLKDLSTYLIGKRKSFRELVLTKSESGSNLATLHQDQYDCYLQAPGRPRRLCLEFMRDRRQKAMSGTGSAAK